MLNSDGLGEGQQAWGDRRPRNEMPPYFRTPAPSMHSRGPGLMPGHPMPYRGHMGHHLQASQHVPANVTMFSPPVSKNGPPVGPAGAASNMEFGGYKSGSQIDEGTWSSTNPPGGSFENRMYEGQSFNGQQQQSENVNMSYPDVNALLNKEPEIPFRSGGMNSSQNLMGPTVPMSPSAMSPSKYSSYYNKRPEGRRSAHGPKSRKVYPPQSPDDYGQESPNRYTSPKPSYVDNFYMGDPSPHGASDPWSSNNGLPTSTYPSSMLPGNTQYSQAPSYSAIHHPHDMGYPTISMAQENMLSSGLPPMSTFRGGTNLPPSSSSFSSSSPSVNGDMMGGRATQGPSQTGDALGKALASIYSPTDHTSSNYGSNSSTPVSSPPPMSGAASQWQRPPAQSSTSPHFESGGSGGGTSGGSGGTGGSGPLHNLSRMEERIEDAIHVLRHHAEMPGMPGHPQGLPSTMMGSGSHSNGMMGSMGGLSGLSGMASHLESLTSSHHSMSDSRPSTSDPAKPIDVLRGESSADPDHENLQAESLDKAEGESMKSECSSGGDKSQLSPGGSSTTGPPAKRSRSSTEPPEEDESPEAKAERERVRRQANNARESTDEDSVSKAKRRQANNDRERVRVRDINEAFKELGTMVSLHTSSSQPLTKLMILQHAVNVITTLEAQVRERNLNPKAACLKRREEEKTDEMPGGRGLSSDDIAAQQAALADSPSMSVPGMMNIGCSRVPGARAGTITGGRDGEVPLHSAFSYLGQENNPVTSDPYRYSDVKYSMQDCDGSLGGGSLPQKKFLGEGTGSRALHGMSGEDKTRGGMFGSMQCSRTK
ncbi:transcription factor 4-like isoform X3 [Pecten maximus]|uniref:transcription factor 4-like isoform X3 n=1 Tax=Pecten maximus TaxID=6579 RepID=UPI0014580845|nr:transcription factor 4-like isoform X3 [Pecten maximus]